MRISFTGALISAVLASLNMNATALAQSPSTTNDTAVFAVAYVEARAAQPRLQERR